MIVSDTSLVPHAGNGNLSHDAWSRLSTCESNEKNNVRMESYFVAQCFVLAICEGALALILSKCSFRTSAINMRLTNMNWNKMLLYTFIESHSKRQLIFLSSVFKASIAQYIQSLAWSNHCNWHCALLRYVCRRHLHATGCYSLYHFSYSLSLRWHIHCCNYFLALDWELWKSPEQIISHRLLTQFCANPTDCRRMNMRWLVRSCKIVPD